MSHKAMIQSHIERFIVNQFNLTTGERSKPQRFPDSQLFKYSKVIDANAKIAPLPVCITLQPEIPQQLNTSAPSNLFKSQRLLSLDVADAKLLDVPLLPQASEPKQDDQRNRPEETFEHYDKLNWPNSRISGLQAGSKSDGEVSFSLYTSLMICAILVIVMLICRKKGFLTRGRKRRARNTLKRLLRQVPQHTPSV